MRRIFEKFTPSDFRFLSEVFCRGGEEKAFLSLVEKDPETLD